MCKLFRFLFPVLSVYAACICTLWLCPSLPRILSNKELQFDYIGAIIGILSFLVVFTVSWQIINAIDVKKELDKAKNEREKLNEEMNKNLMSIVSNVCGYMGDIAEMVSKRDNAHWEYFIISIKHYNKYSIMGNIIMKDIAKSHIIKSIKMEQEKYGEIATRSFIEKLIENLNFEDINKLRIDAERHTEKSKDDEILKNLLDVLMQGINNRNEMRRKIDEYEHKEQQEQSIAKIGSGSTSSDDTSGK